MPAIDLSVLCIPAECDNIKLPIEYEIASRWDAYLLYDICRHFASVMLHFASLISHNLRCIPAYTHQIPTGFFQSSINNHRDNLYIISLKIPQANSSTILQFHNSTNARIFESSNLRNFEYPQQLPRNQVVTSSTIISRLTSLTCLTCPTLPKPPVSLTC